MNRQAGADQNLAICCPPALAAGGCTLQCRDWPPFLQVGELFSFHVVLISKGMTTYDYIVAQREKQTSDEESSGMSEALSNMKGVFQCMCCCRKSSQVRRGNAEPFFIIVMRDEKGDDGHSCSLMCLRLHVC